VIATKQKKLRLLYCSLLIFTVLAFGGVEAKAYPGGLIPNVDAATDGDFETYLPVGKYGIGQRYTLPVSATVDEVRLRIKGVPYNTSQVRFLDVNGNYVNNPMPYMLFQGVGGDGVTDQSFKAGIWKNVKYVEFYFSTHEGGQLLEFNVFGTPNYPVPFNLQAASGAKSIKLEWLSLEDTGFDSYRVFMDDKEIGSTKNKSFVVENLAPDIPHQFYVRSQYGNGLLSSPSNVATARAFDYLPDKPVITAAEYMDRLELTWTTDPLFTVYYLFWVNGVLIAQTSDNTYTINNLEVDKVYSFYVQAVDKYGRSVYSDVTSFTTRAPPPEVPPVVTVSNAKLTSLDVSWTKVGLYYDVYLDDEYMNTVTANRYQLKDLDYDTEYIVAVIAHDNYGRVVHSEPVKARTLAPPDIEKPVIKASSIKPNSILLGFSGVSPPITVYQDGIELGLSNLTYFNASRLEPETSYVFKIIGLDKYGRRVESDEQSFSTVALPTPKPSSGGGTGPGPNPTPLPTSGNPSLDQAASDLVTGVDDTKKSGMTILLIIIGLIIFIVGFLFLVKIMKRNAALAVSKGNANGKEDGGAAANGPQAATSQRTRQQVQTGSRPKMASNKPKSYSGRKHYHGYRKSYR
jgi:hypothetical protein